MTNPAASEGRAAVAWVVWERTEFMIGRPAEWMRPFAQTDRESNLAQAPPEHRRIGAQACRTQGETNQTITPTSSEIPRTVASPAASHPTELRRDSRL